MGEVQQKHDLPSPKEKTWAVVRIILGQGQMIGAIVSLCLLVQTGMNALSLSAVIVTCLLTTISVLLFGGRKSR